MWRRTLNMIRHSDLGCGQAMLFSPPIARPVAFRWGYKTGLWAAPLSPSVLITARIARAIAPVTVLMPSIIILPLGWYGNVAPVLGYRSLDTPTYSVSGFNVGFRIVLIPSRTGAADLSLTQTWVAPGTPDEVGLTTFSVGYAVTSQLRIATDIQTQNAPGRQDSRVGVLLEWLL
jgi:hypothetical protein